MIEAILIAVFVGILVGLALLLRGPREVPSETLVTDEGPGAAEGPSSTLIGLAVGLLVGFALVSLLGAPALIAFAGGALAFITTRVLVSLAVARRATRTELRLADAIDLLVSSLRAGSSLLESLDSAAQAARSPIREMFIEMSERVRIGETHESVLGEIEDRYGLESVRMFTFALSAHWEGAGSLATSLSGVGRAIRDRVAVTRRVQSQTIETQASVVGVLVITYGLALLMWNNYPTRVETFVNSELGSAFIAASIILQAVGLLWINAMTRVEV